MILLVHGGAGSAKPGKKVLGKLSESLSSGYRILRDSGTARDAVIASITVLEDSGILNAGSGGNLQFDGVRRLDASLMEGASLAAGSVIGLEGIRNPIMAARAVMDLPHVILTNTGAKRIAEAQNLPALPSPDKKARDRLSTTRKKEQTLAKLYRKLFSTVGAVALDGFGNLAAGSSTGGVSAMLPGRVGDTPIIGAGIYAENSLGAASCTGMGEYIIRLSLAKEVCMNMKVMSPARAASSSLRRLLNLGGQGGIILINRSGRFSIMHTTEHLASGYADAKGIVVKEGFKRV